MSANRLAESRLVAMSGMPLGKQSRRISWHDPPFAMRLATGLLLALVQSNAQRMASPTPAIFPEPRPEVTGRTKFDLNLRGLCKSIQRLHSRQPGNCTARASFAIGPVRPAETDQDSQLLWNLRGPIRKETQCGP